MRTVRAATSCRREGAAQLAGAVGLVAARNPAFCQLRGRSTPNSQMDIATKRLKNAEGCCQEGLTLVASAVARPRVHAAVSGTPLAATRVKSAGAICKRRDAVRLARKEALQRRARHGPAIRCWQQLGGQATTRRRHPLRSPICDSLRARRLTLTA